MTLYNFTSYSLSYNLRFDRLYRRRAKFLPLKKSLLSDNLYSRWRRTCTSHVHGVVHRQYLHRALGAPGQSRSSTDQPISSMNCPICISWQLWARSADSRSLSAIIQSFKEIIPYRQTLTPHCHKTTLIEILPQLSKDEILRDSTRFHEIPPQSSKDDPDNKDDPDDKDNPNEKNTISIPPWPISQMTPPTSSLTTIILNKPEDWEQWL
jgi:hypothetical protein